MTPSDKVISFRHYLQNGIIPFASEFTDSKIVSDLLTEFVVVLSNYQEEGVHLYPVIFISEDLPSILSTVSGADTITVGSGPKSRETVQSAFKECAPLAEGRGWAIFTVLMDDEIIYGIFRTDQSPLNPTPFERLRRSTSAPKRVIGLTRMGGGFIELRSDQGKYKYIDVTGSHEDTKNPSKIIRDFVKLATQTAPDDFKMKLQSFYYRVGIDLLHSGHGSLIAVAHRNEEIPEILQDGILLEPKIDILLDIEKLIILKDTDSFQRLIAKNQLLRKMALMDGITVIDTAGAILGYNCFIRNSALERKYKKSHTIGGARRRAFDVLSSYVGESLAGVLYKSQDGHIDLTKS